MKTLVLICFPFLFFSQDPAWVSQWSDAQALAKTSHKPILVNFSGSDWCVPCMRMHKEIFGSASFQKFASDNLVLYNADFPRMKKNQLPKDKVKANEQLADRYNAEGKFPLTLLLDENGNVIHTWDGYPDGSAEDFVVHLREALGNH